MKAKSFSAWITLLLVAFMAVGAFAQSLTTGDVIGQVADSAGAVIPNATVTLKSEATGQVRTQTTNASGNYRFPLLQPGTYTVSVTAQGFAVQKRAIAVSVGQTPELNFSLNVKGSSEVVEVSGEAPLLQTENGNASTAFSQQQVNLLPNGGGDLTAFADLAPGTVPATGGGYGNFTSNGLPANTNVFTINGTNNMDPYFNTNNSGATNLSLGTSEIAEAAVVSNAFSAEYGQQAGAQVTYVTKSGNNSYHGEANYKWTGRALSARDAFNAKPDPQPFTNNNQYSAQIGGPIIKDKTFFFVNTEGLRYILATSSQTYIPSTEYQDAVIGYLQGHGLSSEVPVYQQAFDYYNHAPNANLAVADPTSPCDADTLALLGLADGTNCTNTFRSGAGQGSSEWLMSVRIDHNFSQYDRSFFRFHTDHGMQATYTDPISSDFNAFSPQPSYGGQAQWTHIFKSGATNQLIASSDYYSASFQPTKKGFTDFPYSFIFLDMPYAAIGGENYGFPQGRDVHQHQLIDDYSTRLGNHTLKAGLNYRLYKIDDYIFQRRVAVPLIESYNIDFAQGYADIFASRYPSRPSQNINIWGLGAYVEDDWKVNSNFTLNFGLRFEHNSNPTCDANCFSQLNGTWDSVSHDTTEPYSNLIKTGLNQAYNGMQAINVAPRVAFAWNPSQLKNLVVRGGYGIFFDSPPAATVDNMASNFPGFTSLVNYNGVTWVKGAPGNGWDANSATNTALVDGYKNNYTLQQIMDNVAAAGGTFAAPSFTALPTTTKTPMYQKWSLEIQKGIGNNDSLTLSYTGNHGTNIAMPNGFVNGYNTHGVSPFTVTAADARLGTVTQYDNSGFSNYNGFTATFAHRVSANLKMQLNYTWAHSQDTISNMGGNAAYYSVDSIQGYVSPYGIKPNYASSDYDVRHLVTMNYVWQPKFDQWLHLPKVIGSDWVVSGILLAKTGTPFSVLTSGSNARIYNGAPSYLLPIYDGGAYTCDGLAISNPCLQASKFQNPNSTTGAPYTSRNMFRGPGYFDTDLTVEKGFSIPGRDGMKLFIGATAYNVLNHPNWATPCDNITTCGGSFGLIQNTVSPATSPFGAFTGSSASARILQLNAKFQF